MVTLLNFVIAILSNTYTILTEKSNAIYLQQIIILNQTMGFDKKIGAIVCAPVGLNLFFLPFIPIIYLFKSKKLNKFFLIL